MYGSKGLVIVESRDEDEGYDESVECEGFSEDEDQDQSYEEPFLEGIRADAYVSYLADRVSGSLNYTCSTTQLKPHTSPEAMWEKPFFRE